MKQRDPITAMELLCETWNVSRRQPLNPPDASGIVKGGGAGG